MIRVFEFLNMRIYLLGFMGSGKSTFGKKLSEKLDYTLMDIDQMMEVLEKKSVSEIFKEKGEEYFRRLEADILHSSVLHKNAVISCGGGTPCYFDNMDWMNERGLTIYLNMPPEILYGRLKERKAKRPLIANLTDPELKDYIFQKLSEREIYYLRSKLIMDVSVMEVKDRIELVKMRMLTEL